jgi:hypothetical protein
MDYHELADFEDLFKWPWEGSTELDIMRRGWENLKNQAIGRGINPRKDVSSSIQRKISKDYEAFRFWEDRIGLLSRATASYHDELIHFQKLLVEDTAIFTKWLKDNKPDEAPPSPPALPSQTNTEDIIKYGVTLGGIALIAYAIIKAKK